MVTAVLIVSWALAAFVIPFDPDEQRPGTRLGGPLAADPDTDVGVFRMVARDA